MKQAIEAGAGPKLVVIQASSSGFHGLNLAKITVNDNPVVIGKNENDNDRGLHIAVINPCNGEVESAECFDTYKSSVKLDAFIAKALPEGHIVVAACKDECFTQLSEKAK